MDPKVNYYLDDDGRIIRVTDPDLCAIFDAFADVPTLLLPIHYPSKEVVDVRSLEEAHLRIIGELDGLTYLIYKDESIYVYDTRSHKIVRCFS